MIMGVVFGRGKQPNTTYVNYRDAHPMPKFVVLAWLARVRHGCLGDNPVSRDGWSASSGPG